MPVIEFHGKTTEEAIEKACNQLHLPSDELKFEIVTTGSSGLFGLGGKKAVIRVTVEEKLSRKPAPAPRPDEEPTPAEPPRPPAMPQPESLGRREEDQPAASEAAEEPEAASPETEPDPTPEQRPAKPAGERSGRKRGDRRPPRESKRAESAKPRPEPAAEPEEDEEAEELPLDAGDAPLPATMAGPGESVHEGPEDEIMAESREILENILKLMDVDAQVDSQRIDDRVILNVTGENGGLLIGKKGATLDALQFLVNKIINREHDEKYRVIVDTENYRVRRHQSLIELANRMADKARRTRRPITISQLSAHDRRVVHLALQDKQGLRTRSRGDGPLKNVVIVPQGKRNDRRRSSQGARGGGDQ